MIARAADACMSSGRSRRTLTASSISLLMVVSLGTLVEELEQRDREGSGAEPVSDQDAREMLVEPELEISNFLFEIGLRDEVVLRHVLQQVSDALSGFLR